MSGDENRKTYSLSRWRERPVGAEDPHEVFLDVCTWVCASYAARGFLFAKSGPHMTRRNADISCAVRFQSDPNNIAGERVILIGHASVSSPRLKKWQGKNNGVWKYGRLAGGQLGALQERQEFIQWNLADPATRDDATSDIIAHIERFAMPLFDRCSDMPKLFDDFAAGDLPLIGMTAAMLVEAAVALASRDLAIEIGRRAYRDLTAEGQENFRVHFAKLGSTGPDTPRRSAWGMDLARVAFVHDLEFSS